MHVLICQFRTQMSKNVGTSCQKLQSCIFGITWVDEEVNHRLPQRTQTIWLIMLRNHCVLQLHQQAEIWFNTKTTAPDRHSEAWLEISQSKRHKKHFPLMSQMEGKYTHNFLYVYLFCMSRHCFQLNNFVAMFSDFSDKKNGNQQVRLPKDR